MRIHRRRANTCTTNTRTRLAKLPKYYTKDDNPKRIRLVGKLCSTRHSNTPILTVTSAVPAKRFKARCFRRAGAVGLFDSYDCCGRITAAPRRFPHVLRSTLRATAAHGKISMVKLPNSLTGGSTIGVSSSIRVCPGSSSIYPTRRSLVRLTTVLGRCGHVALFYNVNYEKTRSRIVRLSRELGTPITCAFGKGVRMRCSGPCRINVAKLLKVPSNCCDVRRTRMLIVLKASFPCSTFLPSSVGVTRVSVGTRELKHHTGMSVNLYKSMGSALRTLLPVLRRGGSSSFLLGRLGQCRNIGGSLVTCARSEKGRGLVRPRCIVSRVSGLTSSSTVFAISAKVAYM